MFRKRTREQIRNIEDGERFAKTAVLTFLLVYLTFPIFLLAGGDKDAESSGNLGGLIFLIWFLGLGLAIKMFFFGMIAGALSFFPIYQLLTYRLGIKFAATIAAPVAAYFAVLVSYHISITFSPFDISWRSEYGAYAFSQSLGTFAAIIALPITRIMWRGANTNA